MFTGYKGRAKRLDNSDPSKVGAMIGVGEDEIRAFMDVEAGGSGFDARGRVKMLFEPHVFYRELGAGRKRDKAVKQGLAYAKWKPDGYPADSYPRLQAAMLIDEEAALRSASWGLGQLMGFNHAAAGYDSPYLMIKSFADDEENQLRAMVQFLIAKKLAGALKAHDWAKIERVYNGGGYKGHYAAKMQNAFARWQQIKDTPWNPAKQDEPEIAMPLVNPPQLEPLTPDEPAAPAPATPTFKTKPVLKHRRVWTTIAGFVGGSSALSLAPLASFEWQALAIILLAIGAVGMFFWFVYRREIRAGLFGPSEGA